MRTVRVLTVNAGSTSLKLESYALAAPLPPIAQPPDPLARANPAPDDAEPALAAILHDGADVVAHRFVRLPDGSPSVMRLDDNATTHIRGVAGEAPLHDAPALRGVEIVQRLAPNVPQLAVADGAFHRTLPPAAATYAIPRDLTRAGLRRLGYHGLSHEYAAHRAAALAGREITSTRIVTLHLGGGSSLCAIRNGESIDTTMGYTPLDGIPMATRSGAVDPGLLIHLLRTGTSIDDLEQMLERHSGLLGISGRTGDVRDLLATRTTDPDAALALDVLTWRTRAALGAMIATLGGVDLIAFTGGIGEHAAAIRGAILEGTSTFGILLDQAANEARTGDGCISLPNATTRAYVVAARENWQLARAAVANA